MYFVWLFFIGVSGFVGFFDLLDFSFSGFFLQLLSCLIFVVDYDLLGMLYIDIYIFVLKNIMILDLLGALFKFGKYSLRSIKL